MKPLKNLIEIKVKDYDCTSEAFIYFMGERIGVVGGSRSVDTVRASAEEVVHDALMELWGERLKEIVQANPYVKQVGFTERYDDDYR